MNSTAATPQKQAGTTACPPVSKASRPTFSSREAQEASPAARTCRVATAPKRWVTGKVGEWLQGVESEGVPVVFALTVSSSPFRTLISLEPAESLEVIINPEAPADHEKVQRAIKEMAFSYDFENDCGYRITLIGSPPRGKGLGSSSIDIASVLLAIKDLRGLQISAPELFKLMCRVERSDYLFHPGLIVSADPSNGDCAVVGEAPKCLVLAWDTDPGTVVKTDSVLHLDIARRSFSQEYQELFAMIQSGETEWLLEAASRSAELNNRILPKIGFSTVRKLVNELPGVGMIAAHTGTILGLVLPEPVDKDLQKYIWNFVVDRYLVPPMVFAVGAKIP